MNFGAVGNESFQNVKKIYKIRTVYLMLINNFFFNVYLNHFQQRTLNKYKKFLAHWLLLSIHRYHSVRLRTLAVKGLKIMLGISIFSSLSMSLCPRCDCFSWTKINNFFCSSKIFNKIWQMVKCRNQLNCTQFEQYKLN